MNKVDILAFGAHPDDIEIGCGGFLAKERALGYSIGMVDLTQGEMGTNGDIPERRQEALKAAEIIGASWRINLSVPDGNIEVNDENLLEVVNTIRDARPRVILAPYWQDRHPDHIAASQLIFKAAFTAGLRKFNSATAAYRPQEVLYYFINTPAPEPSFVVDVSEYYSLKKKSILAHHSQFERPNKMLDKVRITNNFPYLIESRDRYFGARIGALYGEAFVVKNFLRIEDPMTIWRD